MTRRLYVSDVHLTPGDNQRLAAFTRLLQAAQEHVDEIYILGDLCEMWIGDDDDSALTLSLTDLFRELTRSTKLGFVAGNRDFLLGEAFEKRTGLKRYPDPHKLEDGTLLAHGDSLCTDDKDYQQMRALLRSSEWQKDILSKTLDERRAFGQALREQSMAANANKAGNIMDVNATAVAELIRDQCSGSDKDKDQAKAPGPDLDHESVPLARPLFIHGHTHRPAIHALPGGGTRLVLGSWERCGWWAVQDSANVRLRCASIDWLSRASLSETAPHLFGL